jgi:DNA-binding LacI/PurR family transcriptional regulator
MTDIASEIGVSVMTVSLALRNHAKIPAATRERVHRAAIKLGYVRSPEISRLMHLLRAELPSVQRCTLGVLTFAREREPPLPSVTYPRRVIDGARRRAEQIGCVIDEVVVDIERMSAKRTSHMLESRGIRGVLIPPQPHPLDCGRLLDWSRFAVVAATFTAEGLPVDRVVPNHYANSRLLFNRLIAQGYKRIGVALSGDMASRFNDCHHAIYCQMRDRRQIHAMPWLIDATPTRLRRWLERHRPEIVVADWRYLRALGAEQGPPTVLLSRVFENSPAGIDQMPEEIGRVAAELLAGKVTRGEFGLPHHPVTTLVEGEWREA